jgi:MFS family permease
MSDTPRFAALQSHDFRMMWIADLIAVIGNQLNIFAINWQIVQLLRDQTMNIFGATLSGEALQAFGLGMVGLSRVIPIVILALISGMIADAYDRRTILLWSRAIQGILLGLLAVLTFTGNLSVWVLYLMTMSISASGVLGNPARQALVPNLVKPEHLTNALSLNTLMFQIGIITGPALFAILISVTDLGTIYIFNALSFIVVMVALWQIAYRPKEKSEMQVGWQALKEGVKFTFGTRIILSTMLLDFFATFFSSAQTMLPLVVTNILQLDAQWYGIIGTAQPVGAIVAGSIMAMRKEIHHKGLVLLASVIVYGIATAIFGLSTSVWLSYLMYALTGAGDTISTVIRNVIRQVNTPDHLRGRMTSVNMIFFMGGPQLGEFEAGIVAAAFGLPFSIVSGGVATVLLTLWVAWKFPSLRNYTGGRVTQ